MSGSGYGAMTTGRLLGLFVQDAKAAGNRFAEPSIPSHLLTEWQKKLEPTPERIALAATILALGAELSKRRPMDDVRRLLVDEHPDVRGWAAVVFLKIDTEWAYSAMQGLLNGISTQEVVALSHRLGDKPPARPTLQEMSKDELMARFDDAVMREFGTRFLDCVKDQSAIDLRNDILGEVWDVMRELKARGALDKRLPLLSSPNPAMRREAAIACLRLAETQATAVLEEIAANGGDDDKYAAKDALIHWRDKGVVVCGV